MTPSVRKNLWLLEFVAIAVIAYLLAKMTVNLVAVRLSAPPKIVMKTATLSSGTATLSAPQPLAPDALEAIVTRNIFDSENKAQQAENITEDAVAIEPATTPSGEPVLTSLSIQLLSTFAVGDGKDRRSSATIVGETGSKEADVFRVEEPFQTGTKITQILHDRVIFTNNNRLEYVLLNEYATAAKSKPASPGRPGAAGDKKKPEDKGAAGTTKYTIDRSEIDNALSNLDQLLTQIRAVPYSQDGKMSGLKLLSVRGDSIFSKLGLQRGDVLQKINGKDFDIKQGLDLFNSLKNESHIALDVIRRGKPQTLEYEVKG